MKVEITTNQLEKIIALAKKLQQPQQNARATVFTKRLGPIIEYPEAKTFLIRMLDTSFRSNNYKRVANYVLALLKSNSRSLILFSKIEVLFIKLFQTIGFKIPVISIPLMLKQVKKITGPILFFVGTSKFQKHAQKRKKENVNLNVNLIGESLIGEKEASERIDNYCQLLRQEDVDYISIKTSTISSQIKPLAFEDTVEKLTKKLAILYTEILKIEKETGTTKFVNLDMEEFRDLEITVAIFKATLELPIFKNLRAGIVLQAYLPEAYDVMLELKKWATKRVKNGGAPIKIRLVKGANLEMEKTEASFEDWPLATYHTKLDTDANYKKILLEMLDAKSASALHIGIASHNIFDLAFALHFVKEQQIEASVDFEMLEGMANETVHQLLKEKVSVLLYTPIVKVENYNSAIAYLVRRLDEGTQEGNFLKEGFKLQIDSPKWLQIKKQFLTSIDKIKTLKSTSHRTQDRATQSYTAQTSYKNVANTDWGLAKNRKWIVEMRRRWETPLTILGETIPIIGNLQKKEREHIQLNSWNGIHPWSYELADLDDYKTFLSSDSEWTTFSIAERAKLLRAAAVEIEKNRADLIGVAVTELGKTIAEVDVEVSEAIDFANYYAQNMLETESDKKINFQNRGVHLVLSPWNFPIAIPIGGVLASLAAGKRVILKPSQNAAACGYLISKSLWNAGVPKSAFSFLPTPEHTLDSLITDPKVFDAVILTGGTNTAKFLLDRTPHLNLYAETGGKNATIVTSLSDREQAIQNVVQSAFGNAGQKCSATSLLILEEEVFNDKRFKLLLKDCTESKTHGSPWNFETEIGPLAVSINKNLLYVLENTADEQWLVKPKLKGKFMLSPGIKWGVTTDDFEFKNELFGPILSVMKAKNLQKAIEVVNNSDFGLTSGIESLDPNEISLWANQIKAGNLYANRPTTGAIVQRQPFGGMKASSFGFGMKAGGPNYISQFQHRTEKKRLLEKVIEDYKQSYKDHFSKKIDYANLRGQHNTNCYIKPKNIIVCIDAKVSLEDVKKIKAIGEIIQVPVTIYSVDIIPELNKCNQLKHWKEIYDLVSHDTVLRVLNAKRIDVKFHRYCHNIAVNIYKESPSNYGRYEWLLYLTEQNRSINYHRYGNLMGETVNTEV
jgi:RHH-type proline utilization regulon transcriptional repressor/proline dehydrogenase/delta 1-pyrroline-5-carboxylate dehydrogenase